MNKVASADLIPGPKRSGVRQKERAKTTSTVLRSTLNGVIWLIAIFMILAEFGQGFLKSVIRVPWREKKIGKH